jgi:hypothetical protein
VVRVPAIAMKMMVMVVLEMMLSMAVMPAMMLSMALVPAIMIPLITVMPVVLLMAIRPVMAPVSVICIAHCRNCQCQQGSC